MTDEKYTLVHDIKEKKAAARGAFARKGGSRSKRCSLPSDNLTPAQLKRRNSQVSTIKLNQPTTYLELMDLTPSLRFLYLDNLIHRYKARRVDLVAMLGITQRTFSKMAEALPGKLTFEGKAKHPSPEWLEFIGGQAPEITPPDSPETDVDPGFGIEEPEIMPPPEPTVKVEPLTVELPLIIRPTVLPDKVTFSLAGTPGQLVDLLPVFTKPDNKYRFELSLTLIDE